MHKKSLTQFILERLNEAGQLTLESFLPRHRAEAKIWRQLLGLSTDYNFSPRTFSTLLSRLKQQGLVAKSGRHGRSVWQLTLTGEEKINLPLTLEPPPTDGISRLVFFDIPETERKKRDLLRSELVACNFRQLQKSVWLGYNPLPERFIKSLDDLKLKNKVHIVSINKIGTLEEV